MPKWGLTEEQINCGPWGLKPELLRPAKTLTDPVHGDVYLNRLELLFLDSPPLQRLRRLRQLGTTYLVYPGATHTRLSHALGALRAAQDLVDAVIGNRDSPRHSFDLLDEWGPSGSDTYKKKLAEATVLARLGALLHDLGHVPFGHTIEDELQLLQPHDKNRARFDRLWAQIPKEALDAVSGDGGALQRELRDLILSKEAAADAENEPQWRSRYPFVKDIVGNTICADLMDYIRRDHLFAGLPIAVGDRFADDFYVVRSNHVHHAERMAIRITRNGKVRSDIVTELLKYLRYRYELSERALYHHAKVAVDAMIGKLLEMWKDAEWVDAAVKADPSAAEQDATDIGAFKAAVESIGRVDISKVNRGVESRLEDVFVKWSDDGLLEHLADIGSTRGEADKRWGAIAELARSVLDRQLFKPIGWASGPDAIAVAAELYALYRSPDSRRELEREAALYAGLKRRFHVVLWVPNPDMKLKVADVLVDANGTVMPLSRFTDAGYEIVKDHKALWRVGVYAHQSVLEDDRLSAALLAFLSERMGVTFLHRDGSEALLPHPLAVGRLADAKTLTKAQREELLTLDPAAKSAQDTYAALERIVELTARQNGFIS